MLILARRSSQPATPLPTSPTCKQTRSQIQSYAEYPNCVCECIVLIQQQLSYSGPWVLIIRTVAFTLINATQNGPESLHPKYSVTTPISSQHIPIVFCSVHGTRVSRCTGWNRPCSSNYRVVTNIVSQISSGISPWNIANSNIRPKYYWVLRTDQALIPRAV